MAQLDQLASKNTRRGKRHREITPNKRSSSKTNVVGKGKENKKRISDQKNGAKTLQQFAIASRVLECTAVPMDTLATLGLFVGEDNTVKETIITPDVPKDVLVQPVSPEITEKNQKGGTKKSKERKKKAVHKGKRLATKNEHRKKAHKIKLISSKGQSVFERQLTKAGSKRGDNQRQRASAESVSVTTAQHVGLGGLFGIAMPLWHRKGSKKISGIRLEITHPFSGKPQPRRVISPHKNSTTSIVLQEKKDQSNLKSPNKENHEIPKTPPPRQPSREQQVKEPSHQSPTPVEAKPTTRKATSRKERSELRTRKEPLRRSKRHRQEQIDDNLVDSEVPTVTEKESKQAHYRASPDEGHRLHQHPGGQRITRSRTGRRNSSQSDANPSELPDSTICSSEPTSKLAATRTKREKSGKGSRRQTGAKSPATSPSSSGNSKPTHMILQDTDLNDSIKTFDSSATNGNRRRSTRTTSRPDRLGSYVHDNGQIDLETPLPSRSTGEKGDAKKKKVSIQTHLDDTDREENETAPTSSTENAAEWTHRELLLLREGHSEVDPRSVSFWDEIGDKVGSRTGDECREKWFSLAKTPVVLAKKSKSIALNRINTPGGTDDDIFNATPMRALFQLPMQGNGKSLSMFANLDMGSAIKVSSVTGNTKSPTTFPHQKHGYKTYIKKVKRDVKQSANQRLPRVPKPAKGKKNLTFQDTEGDVEVKGRLSPGGTLHVSTDAILDVEEDDITMEDETQH